MENVEASPLKRSARGLDETSEEEYSSLSTLLQHFASIPTVDKACTFKSTSASQCMFSISQPNLLANENRRYILSSHISKESANGVIFVWAAFPIEMPSGSIMVPSPSGSKLLVVSILKKILQPNSRFGVHLESKKSSMSRPQSMALYIRMDAFDNAGLREFHGMMMKPLLHTSLRSRLPLNPCLRIQATRKGILQIWNVVAGKVKEIGKRTGVKPTLEKENLRFSLSMLTVEKYILLKEQGSLVLDKLFGLQLLEACSNIWFLLGGHRLLESWGLSIAITGHVPCMLLELRFQKQKLVNLEQMQLKKRLQ